MYVQQRVGLGSMISKEKENGDGLMVLRVVSQIGDMIILIMLTVIKIVQRSIGEALNGMMIIVIDRKDATSAVLKVNF